MPNFKAAVAAYLERAVDGLIGEKARRELVGESAVDRYELSQKTDKAIASVNNRFNNEIDKKLAGILSNRLLDDNLVSQDDITAFLDDPNPKRLETFIVNALNTEHSPREVTPNQRTDFARKYVEVLLVELTSVSREIVDRINVGYHQSHARSLDTIQTDIRGLRDNFERIPRPLSNTQKSEVPDYNPPPPPDPTAIPDPTDLPPGSRLELGRNSTFVGREDELQKLADLLLHNPTGNAAVITTGYGGVGKTQLAIEFAYRYGQYFRGVHWISAIQHLKTDDETPTTNPFANEIAACGRAMGLDLLDDLAQAIQMTRQKWVETPTRLVILDNVENEAQLRGWEQIFPSMRVLVTTRWTNWSRNLNVESIALDVLPSDRAIELLRQLAPRLTDEPDEELDKLGQKLGYLPLALDLVGRYLDLETDLSPTDYLAAVEEKGAAITHEALKDYFDEDDYSPTDQKRNVIACFELSWDQLRRETGETNVNFLARKVLRGCSYCAPNVPIPRELLQQAFEDPEDENAPTVRQALKRLSELGMLRPADEGEVGPTIHPLMAEFGRMEDGQVDESVLGVVAYELARLSDDALKTGLPQEFEKWREHIETMAQLAEKAGGNEGAGTLWNNLGYYRHHMIGDYGAARRAYEQALVLEESVFGKYHSEVATICNNLGDVLREMGDLTLALEFARRALAIWRVKFGDENHYVATAYNSLGLILRGMEDFVAARTAFEQVSIILKETGYENSLYFAVTLNNLGMVMVEMSDFAEARDVLEQALAISREISGQRHPTTATIHHSLGELHLATGNIRQAKVSFELALEILLPLLPPEHPRIQTTQDRLVTIALMQATGAKTIEELVQIIEQQQSDDSNNS
jgi:tetratricopeptide (TPR) repeat protein